MFRLHFVTAGNKSNGGGMVKQEKSYGVSRFISSELNSLYISSYSLCFSGRYHKYAGIRKQGEQISDDSTLLTVVICPVRLEGPGSGFRIVDFELNGILLTAALALD